MTQRVDADPGDEIEIALAREVVEINALGARGAQRILAAAVILHHVLTFKIDERPVPRAQLRFGLTYSAPKVTSTPRQADGAGAQRRIQKNEGKRPGGRRRAAVRQEIRRLPHRDSRDGCPFDGESVVSRNRRQWRAGVSRLVEYSTAGRVYAGGSTYLSCQESWLPTTTVSMRPESPFWRMRSRTSARSARFAPLIEQSGAGRRITLHRPFRYEKPRQKPLRSGRLSRRLRHDGADAVARGNRPIWWFRASTTVPNLGEERVSTRARSRGAAEGAKYGIASIAVSVNRRRGQSTTPLRRVSPRISLPKCLPKDCPQASSLNVNVPHPTYDGIEITRQSKKISRNLMVETRDPYDRLYYWMYEGGSSRKCRGRQRLRPPSATARSRSRRCASTTPPTI